MTNIKSIIKNLAEKGKVQHEVTVLDSVFVLETIPSEEQFLVESMTSVSNLREKYKAEGEISSYMDTLAKMRNVSLLAFTIKTIDGVETVDKTLSSAEQFKARVEFRDELATLPPSFIDALLVGYNELYKKNGELYKDLKETLGK